MIDKGVVSGETGTDKNINILIDAYKKYHQKSMVSSLENVAQSLKSSKLTDDVLHKRQVLDKITHVIENRLKNLKDKTGRTATEYFFFLLKI